MATQITAAAIKALREKTGAGMMQCKSALTEAEALSLSGLTLDELRSGSFVKILETRQI